MDFICRLFLCAGCRKQVFICSHCDRGQRYCPDGCATNARLKSLRAANLRYQQSRQGRLKHAERTRRYRLRKKNVTYQGSPPILPNDLLLTNSAPDKKSDSTERQPVIHSACCHFCGASCSAFVRYRFLHRRRVPDFVQLDQRGSQHGQSP